MISQAMLAVYGAQPLVLEALQAVALHKVVPVCSTEAEALAAITQPAE